MKLPLTTPTLPSLLRTLLTKLEQSYSDEGATRDGMPSVDLWSNLLRCLHESGTDRGALPALVRLSTRAVRMRIAFAVRHGWVEERKTDVGWMVALTASGSAVAARWKSLQAAAEEQARARIGEMRAARLRAALETVIVQLPLEHPHYPASYGAADASITGGPGQDWKAVPRSPGGNVSDLSLLCLVSQMLVAVAMSYEERSPVALSLSESVIQRIPPEGRPVRGLGNSVGISALTRHGFVHVTAINGTEVITLTEKGREVRDAYEARLAAVEDDWICQYGAAPVTELRSALYELVTGTVASL